MQIVLESLQELWTNFLRLSPKIGLALIILILLIAIGRLVGGLLMRVLARGKFSATHRNFFRSLIVWLFAIFGIFAGLNILGLQGIAAGLLAGGGVTAIVIGFAFRGIGENFLAGFFLAFSRPFDVGNLIQSGEFQGIVKSIELRSTHIRSADGRDIFIPSAQIFNDPLINFTRDGLLRLSFKVGIDYNDNAAEAIRLLLDTVATVKEVLAEPGPGVIIADLNPAYVELEIFAWADMFKSGVDLGRVRTDVIESCRRALIKSGFTISADIASNIAVGGRTPLDISVQQAS